MAHEEPHGGSILGQFFKEWGGHIIAAVAAVIALYTYFSADLANKDKLQWTLNSYDAEINDDWELVISSFSGTYSPKSIKLVPFFNDAVGKPIDENYGHPKVYLNSHLKPPKLTGSSVVYTLKGIYGEVCRSGDNLERCKNAGIQSLRVVLEFESGDPLPIDISRLPRALPAS